MSKTISGNHDPGAARSGLRCTTPVVSRLSYTTALALVVWSGSWISAANAQDATPQPDQDSVRVEEKIVVTAQRREQSLEDVPVSVSAVSGDEIAARGALSLQDIQYSIPSLQISEQDGSGSSRYVVRGISPPGSGLPTVGRYLNDVPVNTEAARFGLTMPLYDMERIEVLRGPQGALFGEGSIGGTVRFLTKKPDTETVDGFANLSITSVDDGGTGYGFSGAANLPLNSDVFAVRVAGAADNIPGYIDSARFGEDVNETERWSIRTSVFWAATDAIDVNLVYQHLDSESQANQFSDQNYDTTLFVADPASTDRYDFLSLGVEADLGFATLSSTTGYIDRQTSRTPELTTLFGRLAVIPGLEFLATLDDVVNFVDNDSESFSQEFRLFSETSYGGFWQLGVVYRDSENFTRLNADPQVDPLNISDTLVLLGGPSLLARESFAIYGDYTHPIGDQIEINIGARYYEDERNTVSSITTLGAPDALDASVDNDKLTGRAAIRWAYDDNHSVYVSVAQGFRSGGLQFTNIPDVPLEFEPEELTTYELGFKGNSEAAKLAYEVVLFHNLYDNVQVFAPNLLQLQAFDNSGKAEMTGIDLSFDWEPVENLIFTGSYTFNDHEYVEAGVTHNVGDPLDFVADSTYSASADYSWQVQPGLQGNVRLDYQHSDAFQNSEGVSLSFSDNIDTVNLRAGVRSDNWSLFLFGRNVTEENGVIFPAGAENVEPVRTRPREIGIELSRQF